MYTPSLSCSQRLTCPWSSWRLLLHPLDLEQVEAGQLHHPCGKSRKVLLNSSPPSHKQWLGGVKASLKFVNGPGVAMGGKGCLAWHVGLAWHGGQTGVEGEPGRTGWHGHRVISNASCACPRACPPPTSLSWYGSCCNMHGRGMLIVDVGNSEHVGWGYTVSGGWWVSQNHNWEIFRNMKWNEFFN